MTGTQHNILALLQLHCHSCWLTLAGALLAAGYVVADSGWFNNLAGLFHGA